MAALPYVFCEKYSQFYNDFNLYFLLVSDHVSYQDCPAAEPEERQEENL